MGKYSSTTIQESSKRKPNQLHGIWRGIGCLMIVIVPAISIVIGKTLVDLALANKIPLPPQLLGFAKLPDLVYKVTGLRDLLIPLTQIKNLYAYIVAVVICILVISSLISLVYAIIYRVVNPVRYGPLDEPPLRGKAKKHSR